MKIYDIYYTSNGEILEKKDVRQDKMKEVLDKMQKKNEHLLRIKKVREIRDEEER